MLGGGGRGAARPGPTSTQSASGHGAAGGARRGPGRRDRRGRLEVGVGRRGRQAPGGRRFAVGLVLVTVGRAAHDGAVGAVLGDDLGAAVGVRGQHTGAADGLCAHHRRGGVPAGCAQGLAAGQARYRGVYESSDASSLIQVFALTEPGVTPYEALRQAEAGLKKNAGYQRYELKRLGPGDDADAELEYGYRSAKYGPRRILDRAFTGPDQVQYAVLVAGPADDWPRQRERQRIVLASFCPTAYCPAT
ncbi:hypothetical protein SANTM175S_07289 [Streptomyces antimycoticus]